MAKERWWTQLPHRLIAGLVIMGGAVLFHPIGFSNPLVDVLFTSGFGLGFCLVLTG